MIDEIALEKALLAFDTAYHHVRAADVDDFKKQTLIAAIKAYESATSSQQPSADLSLLGEARDALQSIEQTAGLASLCDDPVRVKARKTITKLNAVIAAISASPAIQPSVEDVERVILAMKQVLYTAEKRPKPTIAELEALIDSGIQIDLQPDGSLITMSAQNVSLRDLAIAALASAQSKTDKLEFLKHQNPTHPRGIGFNEGIDACITALSPVAKGEK